MIIDKRIIFFLVSLTCMHVWDILFFQYRAFGPNIWTLLNLLTLASTIFFTCRLLTDWSFENSYFKIVFIFFMIYELTTVVRGWPGDYSSVKNMLQLDFVIWPFFIPIFVFFEKKIESLAQMFKVFYFIGIAFLLISIVRPTLILNRATAEGFIHPFAYGCAFLLVNSGYLSPKKRLVCALVTLVAILSFTYLARRNAIVTFSGYVIAALIIYMGNVSFGKALKFFPLVVALVFFAFFGSEMLPDSLTKKLNERLTEDTRSIVFDAFDAGMKKDMVFGKGMNGTYYCPFNETVTDDGTVMAAADFRSAIENGYRQLILYGGQVQMVFFFLLLLPAALLGIFKSNNNLAKSCGWVIALWLIDMSVYGLPRLVLQYIFVWICVGLCYKKSFRETPEEEIQEAFENVELS